MHRIQKEGEQASSERGKWRNGVAEMGDGQWPSHSSKLSIE